MNDWMTSLTLAYPGVVTTFVVGQSYEGRDIRGVKVNFAGGDLDKRSIFFESMIHSYEWIAGATTTWIINEILTSEDVAVRFIADRYEW